MTTAERLSMRARIEDLRTDLEVLRDEAPLGTDLWNTLAQMVRDADSCLKETGA
jgi:hypothetical protein